MSERNRATGVDPRYQRKPVGSESVGEELRIELAQHQGHKPREPHQDQQRVGVEVESSTMSKRILL